MDVNAGNTVRGMRKKVLTMADMVELLNICNYCAYAPCICGNEPENCADYVQRHGVELHGEEGADNG